MYKLSQQIIRDMAKQQLISDHAQLEFPYFLERVVRNDGYTAVSYKHKLTAVPGPALPPLPRGTTYDHSLFAEACDDICTKHKSAINGRISCLSSVLQVEGMIAEEIIQRYRDEYLKANSEVVRSLNELFTKT